MEIDKVVDQSRFSDDVPMMNIGEKRLLLGKYTIAKAMAIKKEFQSTDQWLAAIQKLDPEVICKTIWILLEKTAPEGSGLLSKAEIKSIEDLADMLPADTVKLIDMLVDCLEMIVSGMPELVEPVKQATKKFRAQLGEMMKKTLDEATKTGPGSSIASSPPTDGP